MGDDDLGLISSASMAIGGMIGGGIFAVLGVVASMSHEAAWLAFAVGGVIALCAGYSAIALNDENDGNGGPITYIENFTGRSTFAGMAGWTFIVGYVGTTAMYAFAFGSYFVELVGVNGVAGVPTRPIVSILVVAVFVGLNVVGAHASGRTENLLVALKLAILLLFSVGGLVYGYTEGQLQSGVSTLDVGALTAAAMAFIAFEGWELLLYDQENIKRPKETVKTAIYAAVVVATAIYLMVAVVTTNLLSATVIQQHAETALAYAAEPFLGAAGFALISLAALLSTASATNATLFSTARFSHRMVVDGRLPDRFDEEAADEPVRMLLVLGVLAAVFTAVGTLAGITSFASLVFIAIAGGLCALAIRQRAEVSVFLPVPVLGLLGAAATAPLLLFHLYRTQLDVFLTLIGIVVVVVSAELFYFEREWLVEEVEAVGEPVEGVDASEDAARGPG